MRRRVPHGNAVMKARLPWLVMLIGISLLTTNSCSREMDKKPRPEYKRNPNSVQAHRLRMRIQDAPGPLKVVVSATQHDVVTPECLPAPNDNPGGHLSPIPTNDIPFELERVSDTEYTGVFYADGMIDEDYHGHGVCRWELIQVQVQLKATGAEGETRFVASLSRDEIRPGRSKTIYFWKGAHPGDPASSINDLPNFGQTDRSRMAAWVKDEDVFSVTLQDDGGAP